MHSTYFCSEPWQRYGGGSKRRRCDDGRLWCTRVPKNPRPNSCGGDRAAGRRHRRRATVLLPTTAARVRAKAVRPDDARRPILDGHTVNRTEAAAVATSHTATVMSRAATAARGCSRYVTAAAIVRAEDSTVPTGCSSALLSWYGCHKQGRLQLVLRKYSFFVFFSSLLRTFCWSPLANAYK